MLVDVYRNHRTWPLSPVPPITTHSLTIATKYPVPARCRLPNGTMKEFVAEPGLTAFLKAGEEWAWALSESGLEFICVYFSSPLIRDLATLDGWQADRITLPSAHMAQDPVMRFLANAAAYTLRSDEPSSPRLVSSIAETILVRFLWRYVVPATDVVAATDGPLSRPRLREIQDYVQANLSDSITVSDLADLVDLSTSHFARLFKDTTGTPPYEFVLHERIQEAQRQLRNTDQSISSIAYATGFSSQSHFTRRFRKITGMTPAAYRKTVT